MLLSSLLQGRICEHRRVANGHDAWDLNFLALLLQIIESVPVTDLEDSRIRLAGSLPFGPSLIFQKLEAAMMAKEQTECANFRAKRTWKSLASSKVIFFHLDSHKWAYVNHR